ncbi:MAG TPA: hypothetical protein VK463_09965 [Desulfomonilaceae bacterium]|nr:hypothetical protein [Desulfomonilaceae bacterium]
MNISSVSSFVLAGAIALVAVSGCGFGAWAQPVQFVAARACPEANMHLVQYSPGSSRELCLQDCRDMYGDAFRGYRNSRYAYATCVQSCENAFWKDFDQNTGNLERQGPGKPVY